MFNIRPKPVAVDEQRKLVVLKGKCVFCKKEKTVTVPLDDYLKWDNGNGMHIQDAMPDVDKGTREFILSSICGPCFDEI